MSWNSMSGAGESETPSVSTSRSVRPPMGKSAGASSAAITRVDQRRIIGREDAEAVADHIIETGASEIEFDMPGFFFRALLVEPAAREERGVHRIVARAAGRGDVGRSRLSLGGFGCAGSATGDAASPHKDS